MPAGEIAARGELERPVQRRAPLEESALPDESAEADLLDGGATHALSFPRCD